jgi:hypothetical protein
MRDGVTAEQIAEYYPAVTAASARDALDFARFIDTAVQLPDPLRHVLLGHDIVHISELSWRGKKGLRVLPDAKKTGLT